ncbi:unnamed protein product [Caenorhabditis bovis]|uniref:Phosphoglycerate mutase family protein n=1 Tax=Caenorhabditis bovis TaxID=2654633 RepID=A0A8S1E8X7_9PELO|nr:unnamed protein product [Caenorhabditis bovis]
MSSSTYVHGSSEKDEHVGYKDDAEYVRSSWTLCLKSRKNMKRITVVMRSAERMDRVFGNTWISTEKWWTKVHPTDLNVPKDITLHPMEYLFNPPITNIGKYSTQLVYRALRNRGVDAPTIYCSPTLRTVQTAMCIAKTNEAKICIEPGLVEPVEWYRFGGAQYMPDFRGSYGLSHAIDQSYKPIFALEEIELGFATKTQEQCIQRIMFVLRNICGQQRDHPAIIIGHAITMDIASRIGQHGDNIEEDRKDEYTSYEDPIYSCDVNNRSQKLDLGVRYPPGSVMALRRVNDSPPYVLETVPNIIPPLTAGLCTNKIAH